MPADELHPISLLIGELKAGLTQVMKMIDEDRKDSAVHRGRTREQLLGLRDQIAPTIITIARIEPIVARLEEEHIARVAQSRSDKRWRAILYSFAVGVGGLIMWIIDEGIKLWKH